MLVSLPCGRRRRCDIYVLLPPLCLLTRCCAGEAQIVIDCIYLYLFHRHDMTLHDHAVLLAMPHENPVRKKKFIIRENMIISIYHCFVLP